MIYKTISWKFSVSSDSYIDWFHLKNDFFLSLAVCNIN